ncbi:MAG: Dabb family protein [Mariprofundus sp.]|nr:Dabb family protein [Mariprofundus sp.]
MIKHIVMWKLRDKADAAEIKIRLEALAGKIPGLLHIEVGIDFLASEQSADVVLYTELESREALQAYQSHPEHQAVVPIVKAAAIARTVVDYEVNT